MANENKDRIIDKVMFTEVKILKTDLKIVDILFVLCIVVLGAVIRMSFIDFESGDWKYWIYNWMYEIKTNGGFKALGEPIGNYTAPYMYILTILTYTKFTMLHAVKYVSIVFDYAAAVVVYMIIYELTKSRKKSVLGFTSIILLPSVIVNSSMWGQCDIIYSTFLLLSVYFLIKKNSFWSLLMFSVAFSFKLQAVFLLPLLVIMWLKNDVKFRHFSLIPITYIAAALPEWMLGRSFKELMLVYFDQAGTFGYLSMQYPNIYKIIGEADREHMLTAGAVFTICMLGCVAYYMYTNKVTMTKELVVTLALFTVMVVVFFMPRMHERYGFMVDLLAVIYGIMRLRRIYIPVIVNICSVLAYFKEILTIETVSLTAMAFAMGTVLIIVGYDLYRIINENNINSHTKENVNE